MHHDYDDYDDEREGIGQSAEICFREFFHGLTHGNSSLLSYGRDVKGNCCAGGVTGKHDDTLVHKSATR